MQTQHDVFIDPSNPDHGALALRFAANDRIGINDARRLVITKWTVLPSTVRFRELGARAYDAERRVR